MWGELRDPADALTSSSAQLCIRSRGDVGQHVVECLLVHGADEGLGVAFCVNDHECWLCRHVEVREHIPRVIVELGEGQTVLVDEPLEGLIGADPGDSDEGDLVAPFLVCRLDRGGFCVATASSGRPEPECGRGPCDRGALERAASDKWTAELQRLGHAACGHGILGHGALGHRRGSACVGCIGAGCVLDISRVAGRRLGVGFAVAASGESESPRS